MGPAETYIRRRCAFVLKAIEKHLRKYPMGETYFGKLAARNPNVVSTLRDGRMVDPRTLDKLVEFISDREGASSGVNGGGEGDHQ